MSYFREVTIKSTGEQKEILFKRLSNSGSDNMNVDGSSTEVTFSIKPPEGEIWRIASWNIYIEDNGTFDASKWGNGVVLTNGLMPKLSINGVVTDLLGFPLKTSGDLSSICDGVQHLTFGTGNEILTAEWMFTHNGQYLRLTDQDELQLVIRDDLTDIVNQFTTVKGYKE